jgi:hypothetical protein
MNNDGCRLIHLIAAPGPTAVPLQPCCMAGMVALLDRDRPDTVWICPFEEDEQETDQPEVP